MEENRRPSYTRTLKSVSFLDFNTKRDIAIKCFLAYERLVKLGKLTDERELLVRLEPRVFFYNSPATRNKAPQKRFCELQYHYDHGKKFYRVKINKASVVIYNAETGHSSGITIEILKREINAIN